MDELMSDVDALLFVLIVVVLPVVALGLLGWWITEVCLTALNEDDHDDEA